MSQSEKSMEQRFKCYKCNEGFKSASQSKRFKCPKCGKGIYGEREKIEFFSDNKKIKELAQGPIVDSDSENNPTIRQFTRKLKPPKSISNGGSIKSRPGWKSASTVKYLPGDERRAVSLFIEENEEFVRDCLSDKNHPLVNQWDDFMYQLLIQQWSFMGYNNE